MKLTKSELKEIIREEISKYENITLNRGLTENDVVDEEATAKKIISMIPKDFGKPFNVLKKDILKTGKLGASDFFDSKHGYEVFYTKNNNFKGGGPSGGRGFYARTRLRVGMVRDIKLSTN